MNYRYRRIGNYLVPLDHSVTNALRTFAIGYSRCGLDSIGVSRKDARKIIKATILGMFRPPDPSQVITLPVSANLGMQVHHGHKLFNFDKNVVTKIFSPGHSAAKANAEIQAARQASCIPAAPRFFDADSDSRWFTEEYIRGTHATKLVSRDSSDYQRFYQDAEKCLLDLQSSTPVVSRTVDEHLKNVVESPFRERWLAAGAPAGEVDAIVGYQQSLKAWIASNIKTDRLPLVATHGDFSLVNAIATREGLRFIDWESVSPGCVFTDIYNFALVERYYGRTSPAFVEEVRTMLQRFRSATIDSRADLHGSAELTEPVARRLYYLERLRFLVERDVTANLRQVTQKSIDLFRQFDVDMGDSPL